MPNFLINNKICTTFSFSNQTTFIYNIFKNNTLIFYFLQADTPFPLISNLFHELLINLRSFRSKAIITTIILVDNIQSYRETFLLLLRCTNMAVILNNRDNLFTKWKTSIACDMILYISLWITVKNDWSLLRSFYSVTLLQNKVKMHLSTFQQALLIRLLVLHIKKTV